MLPEKIKTGYPEKEYTFTGEWEEVLQGHRRMAMRNRKVVFVPVYQADDSQRILPMWLQQSKAPANKPLQAT